MNRANLRTQFEREFNRSLSIHRTFQSIITEIMTQNHWNASIFVNKTCLDKMTYSRIISKETHYFSMRVIVTICIALELDLQTSIDLLALSGLSFSPTNRIHIAYRFLIEYCKGMGIEDCNELLMEWEIKDKYLLGSISKK